MPPSQRPHSLSMGKMRLPIPGKSRGDICADVAVARPSRCWTGYVQIVSDQQKAQSSSHVHASPATHQRHGLRAGRNGHSECVCVWVPGLRPPPLKEHQSPSSNSPPREEGWAMHGHTPSGDPWVSGGCVTQWDPGWVSLLDPA